MESPRHVSRYADLLAEQIRSMRQGSDGSSWTKDVATSALARLEEAEEELRVVSETLDLEGESLSRLSESLRAEGSRFRAVFDSSPDPLLITDSAGAVRYANPAAATFFGISPGALEGKPMAAFVAREERGGFRSRLSRLARLEPGGREPVRLVRRGEATVRVELDVRTLPSTVAREPELLWAIREPQPATAVGAARDAPFLVRSMAELHRSLDVLRMAESAARLVIERFGRWVRVDLVGPDGRLHRVAAAARDEERAFEGPIDEQHPLVRRALDTGAMQRVGLEELGVDAEDTEPFSDRNPLLLPLIAGERRLGVLIVSLDGSLSGERDPYMLLRVFAGALSHALSNARAFEEEAEARRRAEAASRGRARALSGVSHEFRTPLNAIVGYCDLLLQDVGGPLPNACRRYVESLRTSAGHLVGMVDDILDFSADEPGSDAPRSPTRLRPVVQQVEAIVGEMAAAAGSRLEVTIPPEELTLQTDEGRLRQILLNLLDNAVKYGGGGTVCLRVREEDSHVVFDVGDEGPGIAEDELPHIFDAYWRGADQRVRQGSGLGLAVVKQLVARLNGTIDVDSRPGVGTIFTVRLPR